MKEAVRIHASSGTTGKPTVGVYTREDLDIWSDCVARVAVAGGVTAEDIIQISFGYGLFTGALGLLWAGEDWCDGHSRIFWQYGKTDDDVPGFWSDGSGGNAFLCTLS